MIDLRTLKPWDEETVLASVRKTGRAVVVHEANQLAGMGAEVASVIGEKAFAALKAPVLRLGGPDVPAPAAWHLEHAMAPNVDAVCSAVSKVVTQSGRSAA